RAYAFGWTEKSKEVSVSTSPGDSLPAKRYFFSPEHKEPAIRFSSGSHRSETKKRNPWQNRRKHICASCTLSPLPGTRCFVPRKAGIFLFLNITVWYPCIYLCSIFLAILSNAAAPSHNTSSSILNPEL